MNSNTRFLFGIVVILFLIMTAIAVNNILIDKIVDRVIQKLQKDYSPSPYGPDIDPDKIDMDKFKKSK